MISMHAGYLVSHYHYSLKREVGDRPGTTYDDVPWVAMDQNANGHLKSYAASRKVNSIPRAFRGPKCVSATFRMKGASGTKAEGI